MDSTLRKDYRLIAFDLDDTLAPSKSPLPDQMAAALLGLREGLLAVAVGVGSGLHVALRILTVDVLAGLLTVSVLPRGRSR